MYLLFILRFLQFFLFSCDCLSTIMVRSVKCSYSIGATFCVFAVSAFHGLYLTRLIFLLVFFSVALAAEFFLRDSLSLLNLI